MDKKKEKNNIKGITLVALVITIIILLILAGITISLTLGDKGIINMAKDAGKNYQDAQSHEQELLGNLTNEATNIISSEGMQGGASIGKTESQDKIYKVGTYNTVTVPKGSSLSSRMITANTIQIDIHDKYPDYQELTIENFYTVDSISFSASFFGDVNALSSFAQTTQKVSYDSETGILTLIKPIACYDSGGDTGDTFGTSYVTVYIIKGEIIEL